MKPLKDQLCLRCEASGVKTRAELFVETDGLLNSDLYPLCKKCKSEWDREYETLELNDSWRYL